MSVRQHQTQDQRVHTVLIIITYFFLFFFLNFRQCLFSGTETSKQIQFTHSCSAISNPFQRQHVWLPCIPVQIKMRIQ